MTIFFSAHRFGLVGTEIVDNNDVSGPERRREIVWRFGCDAKQDGIADGLVLER
jgi:hypothetical protein